MKFSEALDNYLYAREIYLDPFTSSFPITKRAAKCSYEEAAARMDELVAGTPPPAPIPAPPMQSVYAAPVIVSRLDTK